ncbi:hypothetical protein A2U01_0092641, partial [Trifolium medium]|nr:hypothetical protein [Trifolium medium]
FCTTQQVLARCAASGARCAAQDNSASGPRALQSFGRALRRGQQTCSPRVDFLLTF